MLTEETYESALRIITDMLDELGELDQSIEGYIDLLEFAEEEINVALATAKSDLGEEFEEV